MTSSETLTEAATPGNRFTPRASVRAQLFGAAIVWAVGASILIVRGLGYLQGRYWHAWALGLALAALIALPKSRFLLDRVARKAVSRIEDRGRACFFGFFSLKAWAFVVVMMGGGMTLRRLVVDPDLIGAGIMGAIYLGIGTALVIADRIFWHAALGWKPPAEKPADE